MTFLLSYTVGMALNTAHFEYDIKPPLLHLLMSYQPSSADEEQQEVQAEGARSHTADSGYICMHRKSHS